MRFSEARQSGKIIRNGRLDGTKNLVGQIGHIHGRAKNTDYQLSHHLQEPPRSISAIYLREGKGGLHGGMQGAVQFHLALGVLRSSIVSILLYVFFAFFIYAFTHILKCFLSITLLTNSTRQYEFSQLPLRFTSSAMKLP